MHPRDKRRGLTVYNYINNHQGTNHQRTTFRVQKPKTNNLPKH